MEDGACRGLIALEMITGELHLLRAKAVVVASGGLGRLYEPSTNALICTGRRILARLSRRRPLMDMAMVQYHPTTLAGSGFLMTEAARGEGAYLLNSLGERFMKKYAPNKMELAARDVTSRAEATEIAEGRGIDGNVLLDLRHLGPDVILKKLPQIHEMALDYLGIDMIKEPVPVRPGMHYQMGGIKTDVEGATIIAGLYAAGEVACVSVHGGNRLGANSLLDTIIFGRRSGRASAGYAKGTLPSTGGEELLRSEQQRLEGLLARPYSGETCAGLRLELATMMDEKVGLYRSDAGLHEALAKLLEFRKRYENVAVGDKGRVFNQALTFVLELGFLLDCGETIIRDAVVRKESRGAHTHVDYPDRNDTRLAETHAAHASRRQAGTGNLSRSRHDHSLETRGADLLMQFTIEVGRYNTEGNYDASAVPGQPYPAPWDASPIRRYQTYTVDLPRTRRRLRCIDRDSRIPGPLAGGALRLPQRDLRLLRDVDQRPREPRLQEQARRVHRRRKDAGRVAAVDADHPRPGLRYEAVLG